jgi:hypothetical protein
MDEKQNLQSLGAQVNFYGFFFPVANTWKLPDAVNERSILVPPLIM